MPLEQSIGQATTHWHDTRYYSTKGGGILHGPKRGQGELI